MHLIPVENRLDASYSGLFFCYWPAAVVKLLLSLTCCCCCCMRRRSTPRRRRSKPGEKQRAGEEGPGLLLLECLRKHDLLPCTVQSHFMSQSRRWRTCWSICCKLPQTPSFSSICMNDAISICLLEIISVCYERYPEGPLLCSACLIYCLSTVVDVLFSSVIYHQWSVVA